MFKRRHILIVTAALLVGVASLSACTMFKPQQKYKVEVKCQCPPRSDSIVPVPYNLENQKEILVAWDYFQD